MTAGTPYSSAFAVIPNHVFHHPEMTMAYLRVFETVFQFWNHGKTCYLGNTAIMERTGIQSEGTIRKAFIFLEKHGLLKRKDGEDGLRHLVQPEQSVQVEYKSESDRGVPNGTAKRSKRNGQPVPSGTHNINNINNKNLKKSSCEQTPKNQEPKAQKRTIESMRAENAVRQPFADKMKVCEAVTVDPVICTSCRSTTEWCRCSSQSSLTDAKPKDFMKIVMNHISNGKVELFKKQSIAKKGAKNNRIETHDAYKNINASL